MFELISNLYNTVVDFFTGGGADQNPPPDPCDVGNCLSARAELQVARSAFKTACWWIGTLKATLIVPKWIVSRSLAEYVVILVIAFIIAGPMGIVIAVGVYGISWLFIKAMLPAITEAGENLAKAIELEQQAIQAVLQECPQECQGDTNLSECVHLDNQIQAVMDSINPATGDDDS